MFNLLRQMRSLVATFTLLCPTVGFASVERPPDFVVESVVVGSPLEEPHFTPLDPSKAKRLDGTFLRVNVGSLVDIAELAEDKQLKVGVDANFCGGSEERHLWIPAELLYRDVRVGYIDIPAAERERARWLMTGQPTNVTKTYHFYIDISGVVVDKHLESRTPYDLQRDPSDICVKIRGGGFFTTNFESNAVVISKEMIRGALRSAKRQTH